MINACLVILVITIGLSKSIDFASIKEIQQLKQNSFASSLIETISLTLSSNKGDDANDVLTMLGNLKKQLQDDQVSDDNLFNAKNAEFDDHIKKLDDEIQILSNAIEVLTARIAELTNLIAQAVANIQDFTNRITTLEMRIKELNETHVKDLEYYNNKVDNLAKLHPKLLSVVDTLKRMVGSVSGVDIYSHINKTDSELRDIQWREEQAKKSFLQIRHEIPEEYSNLLEMTVQADQKALNKLIEIINKIAEDTLAEKARVEAYIVEIINTYNELIKQMNDEIDANTEARKRQEENKSKYESEKSEKEQEKASKEERREALRKEREINVNLQTTLRNTYNKEKADRSEEIRVVDILTGIVEKRLVRRE